MKTQTIEVRLHEIKSLKELLDSKQLHYDVQQGRKLGKRMLNIHYIPFQYETILEFFSELLKLRNDFISAQNKLQKENFSDKSRVIPKDSDFSISGAYRKTKEKKFLMRQIINSLTNDDSNILTAFTKFCFNRIKLRMTKPNIEQGEKE